MIASLVSFVQEAATDTSTTDIVGQLFQYGIPGLVIAALLVGLLWAKPAVDRLLRDKEKAETQRDELLKVYEEKILPALADSIVVTRDLKPIIQDVTNVLTQVKEELIRGKK